jgi:hypothetical protein
MSRGVFNFFNFINTPSHVAKIAIFTVRICVINSLGSSRQPVIIIEIFYKNDIFVLAGGSYCQV